MDLLPTEEQQHIVDSARHFLSNEFPVADALNLMDGEVRITRHDLPKFAELGWFGIGLAEPHGGVGYGACEEALLFVELGRELMPPSLLGGVLATRLAATAGADELKDELLEGRCKVALGCARPGSGDFTNDYSHGEFLVYEAADADYVLLANSQGSALLSLPEAGRTFAEYCIDPTISLSQLHLDNTGSHCHLSVNEEDLFLRGSLMVSAMLLGIAEATLDRSVDYAKEREQYGKPIGSFQAIKHYCAEMAIRCESVRAMLYHASITAEHAHDAARFDAHTLKALAIEAAQLNANTAVQIHGGMGYTQEMDIHLFVKRAQILASLFGGERFHLRQLLDQGRPDQGEPVQ
ncbi:MAG: acyl-CoA dehydrogenase family protein [Pseudomonadota bacterium]